MKTTKLAFAKRRQFYQFVPSGTVGIVTPEDSIYLTITGEEDVSSPPERMTPVQMANWLRDLHCRGFSMQAVDGYNHPLKPDLDADY